MKKAVSVLSVFLIAVGVLALIFGIKICHVEHTWPSSVAISSEVGPKGGDYASSGGSSGRNVYSYMIENMARTATNTYMLYDIESDLLPSLVKSIGYCLIIAGLTLILCGSLKLVPKQQTVVVNSGSPAPAVNEHINEDELPEL